MRSSLIKYHFSGRKSPVRNDQTIEADLWRRELNSREIGASRNALDLCEGVSVAGGRSGQHHHAEGSRGGWRNAIRIGNEFSDCGAAARLERGMHLSHESGAGGRIEMVQEIGDQYKIVVGAKVDFEGAAGKQVVAIGNSCCLRILHCDFEHILPIGGIDVCGGTLFCD